MEKSTNRKKRVVVFGTFDGIHDGHRNFFRQARKHGEELIVIVATDGSALRVKNNKPRYSEQERIALVVQEKWVSGWVLGDEELSTYHALEELDPDVICLGYDQQSLGEDLQKWVNERGKEIPIYVLKPYKPNLFHSSLLHPNLKL